MKKSFNTSKKAVDRNPINIHSNTKTERQNVSIQKWQYGGYKGILHITQRFGKTRLGIKAAEVYLKYPTSKMVLIVAPSEAVVHQWNDELFSYQSEVGMDKRRVNVVSFTSYKRMELHILSIYSFIIYDEIHKYITDDGMYCINRDVKTHHIMGLTGTLPNEDVFARTLKPILQVLDVISEQEATDNKWINQYDEYNISLNFTYNEQYDYVRYSKFITETTTLFKNMHKHLNGLKFENNEYFGFKNDYAVIAACRRGAKDIRSGVYIKPNVIRDYIASSKGWSIRLNLHTKYDANIDEYWAPLNIYNRVTTFMDFVEKRNTLIGTSRTKLKTIIELVKDSINVPTIIYVHSTDFAEEVVDTINNVTRQKCAIAYHSQIKSRPLINPETKDYYLYKSGIKKDSPKIFGKTSLKKMYLEGLQLGTYKILVTVSSLNEGLNVPKLSRVILTAGSQNNITYAQRKARVFTIDPNNLEKESIVFNIFFDNFMFRNKTHISRDKTKLLERQRYNECTPTFMRGTDLFK